MDDLKKILGYVGMASVVLIFMAFVFVWTGFNRGEQTQYKGNTSSPLCSSVPEPYKTIFSAAGNKFQVQPAFIAAIFYAGEHANSWPDANGPWASSPAGAKGPFQFMDPTWESNKQDGNGDGVMDVQNLWDSAFGAGHFLASLGAKDNTTDIQKLTDVAGYYNGGGNWEGKKESKDYVARVIPAFQSFMCTPAMAGGGGTGQFIWPINGTVTSGWRTSHRPDHNGLDIAAPNGTPVKAIGKGTIKDAHLDKNNPSGVYIIIDHNNGFTSSYVHLNVGSVKVSVGQSVQQGDIIAEVDNTGVNSNGTPTSTGPHLHLTMHLNGKDVNPLNYLPTNSAIEFRNGWDR